MEATIGIDLGTTFSAVAAMGGDGRAAVLKNSQGDALTPSVIWFGNGEPIVGAEAKEMQSLGEEDIAAFFKRNMGDPNFSLHFNGKDFSAQDLSAILLKTLKQNAEAVLGVPVYKAVITVPAYFNNFQRAATIAAGKAAGLEVLRIINEPTAAAIAYGLNQQSSGQRILVYDLGGGTFDVTIIRINTDSIDVAGTDGDHELGGKNWDDRIVNWAARQFEQEFGEDPLSDSLSFNELLVRAENAKKQLSIRQTTRISITHGGEKGRYDLDIETFEGLTRDLMERTQMLTEGLLKDIGLAWQDIDGVLLVGGSTRMPMVYRWIEKMSGTPPLRGINVDEAVALGAAIQANLDANPSQTEEMLTLGGHRQIRDVMSHSLGLVAINENRSRYINSIIIPKNLPVPSRETRPYQIRTRPGAENDMTVYMLQGESTNPQDCQVIGKYIFSGIAHEPSSVAVVDVAYAYDQNGVIEATAQQRHTGKELSLRVEAVPEDMSWLGLPPEEELAPAHLSLIIAIDLSGSMSGNPLQQSQGAAKDFVRQLDLANTSIGLMVFSDRVQMAQNLCQDTKALFKGIEGWTIGSVGYGNAGQPFTLAQQELEPREQPRYLIVLTDGAWNDQAYAIREAEACKASGIEIIAIGFGGADWNFLKKIATSDENALFTNLSGLTASFSKIAQVLTDSSGLRMQEEKPGGGLRFFD
ncbi:MAG: Hsp70 family protein [Phaeodactylibacter sp.]|nr:Hsp70 family protein [Phaeodactylibacter sp.]